MVTQILAAATVQITLPAGVAVATGDAVQIMTTIPGVGPVAISTLWHIQSVNGRTVVAIPEVAPSGTPQVGYTAVIQTEAVMATQTTESPDVMALFLRAEALATSNRGPADLAKAAQLFRQAADMGHSGAMTALGAAYSFGRGVNRNDAAALEWQGRASRLGNSDAMYRQGLIYLAGRGVPANMTLAADWIHQASTRENAKAMFMLALLYEDGDGVPASMVEMTNWLEAAARLGHTESMFTLGHIYIEGEDGVIAKDVYKAEDYWLAAAKAGHVGAMNELAEFYQGEAMNAAQKWANAARNAPRPPDYTRDPRCLSDWECYLPGAAEIRAEPTIAPPVVSVETTRPNRSPRVIYTVQDCDLYGASPRDPDRPDLEMSIEYDDLDAQRVISECLEDIRNWPDTRRFYAQIARAYHKNSMYAEAFEAAKTSADLGSGQGMAIVGLMYKSGLSVRQDAHEALRWFEKAGHEGNVTAMHFAAGMHLHAQGVAYNPQAAANWYQAAADHKSSSANTSLGILYDKGQGVSYDPVKSAVNLMIGLAAGESEAQELLLQNSNRLTRQTRIAIQQILGRGGHYNGVLDGSFGPQTVQALRASILN